MNALTRLSSTVYEKVWGTPVTEPWYRNSEGRRVGEIWFHASDSVPLLVKFLFTSERLSVQVHPGDEYARVHENSRGKTEMWHILRAEPDARIAAGLREPVTTQHLRAACLSGEVVDMLDWVPVQAGDTFFIPAGTIHAIGAGVAVCEVQELSDVTYRLFDYGRPRELHLDRGLEVSKSSPADVRALPQSLSESCDLLVQSDFFRTERLQVYGSADYPGRSKKAVYVALQGQGRISGMHFTAGDAFEANAGLGPISVESAKATFLITSEP